MRTSLLIVLGCLLVYNVNGRAITAGDTHPARYQPFAILRHGTLYLETLERVAAQGRGNTAYWLLHRPGGRIISLYPVVTPVLVTPLYVPAVAYLRVQRWTDAQFDRVARVMEKVSASLVASLSVALLYLLLRRRATPTVAWPLTLAYAFGTTTWVVSSQALWQHGIAELLIVAVLLLLTIPATTTRAIAAGLLLGLIAANRPPDVVIAAALGFYGLAWAGNRRRLLLLAGASALPLLLAAGYNLAIAGNVAGGYGLLGTPRFFQHDLLGGLGGLLVSPTRGLLVFSPFMFALVLAWRYRPATPDERRLTLAMAIGVVVQIVLYAKADWRGGLSWGPRYLTDVLPLLIWMLVPIVTALRGAGRAAFQVAVAVAVVIEAVGAFTYTGDQDLPIFANDIGAVKHDMRAAWQWRNAAFLTSPRRGVVPGDLGMALRGSLDAIGNAGRRTDAIVAGDAVTVEGWTLTGGRTPWQVAVTLDGGAAKATSDFFIRPDVRASLRTTSAAGWRISLDTSALAPGEHQLTLLAWPFERSVPQFVEQRTVTILAPADRPAPIGALYDGERSSVPADLVGDARTAAGRLREHQQDAGYWLTAFTRASLFTDPHREMNTFLTALLLDVLTPIAKANGLETAVERARTHLRAQIEPSGLVRYHGLPDGPGIGTLGCVITPDTDDTALAWRIAPANDPGRLAAALDTIAHYRTPEGLYRTWLAPRDRYQCLDPGSDPNPPDIGIQMNLLMLLADAAPTSARALCHALRPVVDADRLWVYYRKAPLVPALRLDDLRHAGCALELPDARLRTDIPGQQLWMSVVQFSGERHAGDHGPVDPAVLRALLREIARDDFALVRVSPPLFYHNDLTATVPRFYWSEDLGYALWLRLYAAYVEAVAKVPAR